MRCISPVRVKGGQFVPCGKCNFCLANRRADWSYRLQQELEVSSSAYFVTLTYSDDEVPENGYLRKRDFQLFMKKLRRYECKLESKKAAKNDSRSIRYYAVGEYGTRTNRPHYHAIIFNCSFETMAALEQIWSLGMVKVGPCGPGAIPYVTKYHLNKMAEVPQGFEPSFALMSRGKGGLGINYVGMYKDWHRSQKLFHAVDHGRIRRLPRYFRDKIFTVHDRAVNAVKMELRVLREYWEQVDRLRPYHLDPEAFVESKIRWAYNNVVKKANELNYF